MGSCACAAVSTPRLAALIRAASKIEFVFTYLLPRSLVFSLQQHPSRGICRSINSDWVTDFAVATATQALRRSLCTTLAEGLGSGRNGCFYAAGANAVGDFTLSERLKSERAGRQLFAFDRLLQRIGFEVEHCEIGSLLDQSFD